MSFDRLIVCVDTSGSMSGDKITNAKELLLQTVKAFACQTEYFKFTCAPQKISSYEFSNLSAGGGTRIEYTIKELFGNHFRKWAHEGKNTKFMFVTDAEDSIRDVASCISAKAACVKAYGGKLDCECVLTGGGGGCSSELRQIFGSNAFQHCADKDFQKVLSATCGAISTANTIATTVLPTLDQDINNLKASGDEDTKELVAKAKNIMGNIKTIKTNVDTAKQAISTTKRDVAALNASTPTLIQDADNARSPPEMERAEEAIESQTKAYRSQMANANNAGKQLNEAQAALDCEAKKADKMAEELSKKVDDVSQKASVIVSNIIRTIKELSDITAGAYQQVKHLKGQFNQQLSDLMDVVSKNEGLMKEVERVKDQVRDSFKSLRSQRTALDDCQKEIANSISQLNTALERLDDRW